MFSLVEYLGVIPVNIAFTEPAKEIFFLFLCVEGIQRSISLFGILKKLRNATILVSQAKKTSVTRESRHSDLPCFFIFSRQEFQTSGEIS